MAEVAARHLEAIAIVKEEHEQSSLRQERTIKKLISHNKKSNAAFRQDKCELEKAIETLHHDIVAEGDRKVASVDAVNKVVKANKRLQRLVGDLRKDALQREGPDQNPNYLH